MPPWLPEAGHGEFAEERRLTDQQIALIQQWAKGGAPAGAAADGPAPPQFHSEWQLGPPDLILKVTKPFQLYADGPEVFWNFILPVPISSLKWVRAIEVRPGNARVFHHANVIIDRSRSARHHETTAGNGFPGMDLTVEEDTFDPDGHFLSWKPGSTPVVEPDGMAWRATPGMDLVLNVHLRPSGKPETVSPEIGIYFTDKPQTKFPMLIQLEHDGAIDIAPGAKDFQISDDFTLPLDVNVLTIYPHAHYLARVMEGYATLPDGTKKWLIRIPDWDLGWQGVFRLKEPLLLPKGTVLFMRYHYDNSTGNVRNPNHPPKQVTTGVQATDEMGHLWLQVLPAADGDQRMPLQAALTTQRLAKYPEDFGANFNMGDLLLTQGRALDAIRYFQLACVASPQSAVAASQLGVAFLTASQIPQAADQFRRALLIDPGYTDARYNLASAEAASGQWDAAANDFKRVLTERLADEKARQHLGEVLFAHADEISKAGNEEGAVPLYREALQYRPNDAELHMSLGMSLANLKRFEEAKTEFEAAIRANPNFQPARQALAAVQAQINRR